MPELKNYPDFAVAAWSTDDGSATFCMPIASVIHGFMYNKDIFKELGLEVPKTEAEFFAVLDKIKENGSYIPHGAWAPSTSGRRRPWATPTSARPTGRARRAGRRCSTAAPS